MDELYLRVVSNSNNHALLFNHYSTIQINHKISNTPDYNALWFYRVVIKFCTAALLIYVVSC